METENKLQKPNHELCFSVPDITPVKYEETNRHAGYRPLMPEKSAMTEERTSTATPPPTTKNLPKSENLIGTLTVIVVLALVVAFSVFTGFKLMPELNKHTENVSGPPPILTTSLESSFKKFHQTPKRTLNMTCGLRFIQVTSYIQYQSKMYSIPDNQPVSVHIKLDSLAEWPNRASLARSEQIISLEIEGVFTQKMFDFLLQYVENLENLTVIINNKGSSNLCDDSNEQISENRQIFLPRLKSVALLNFTTCANVFTFFANNVDMSNVRHLRLENGVIDDKNLVPIRMLIGSIGQSLRKLSFPSTKWNEQLLTTDFPILPHLNLFRMDFLTDTNLTQFIGVKFFRVFPALSTFNSVSGLVPWNDFRCILNSSTIVKLSAGIEIPKNRTSFKLYFLEESFPLLKDVHLYLHFDKESLSSGACRVDGLEVLRKVELEKLQIQTNCNMQLGNNNNRNQPRKRLHQMPPSIGNDNSTTN